MLLLFLWSNGCCQFLKIYIYIYICIYINFTILHWFCHTLTWICHGCTCVPHPEPPSHLPIPSFWVIPVHQARASCIEPGQVIRFTYDNIHVSMPFSQTIPPSPSPTEYKTLFYTSVSLLLSCIQGYRYCISYTVLVFFFLAYFTLYNRLQFHPPH